LRRKLRNFDLIFTKSTKIDLDKSQKKMFKNIPKLEDVFLPDEHIKATTKKVFEKEIQWEYYKTMIEAQELEMISSYFKANEETRFANFKANPIIYAELFMDLLLKVSREETVHGLLALMEQLLTKFPESTKVFLSLTTSKPTYPFDPLEKLLNRFTTDWFVNVKASHLYALLLRAVPSSSSPQRVKWLCDWFREQLKKENEKDVGAYLWNLKHFLSEPAFRPPFVADFGLNILAGVLKTFQKQLPLVYEAIYSIWLLSYSKQISHEVNESKILSGLMEVLNYLSSKQLSLLGPYEEKILRLSLATLRNLAGTLTNNDKMIDGEILKPLHTLVGYNWKDEDISSDLNALNNSLASNILILSSYDEYKREVLKRELEWSTVHRSEKFWHENFHRFEEDNNKILLILKELLSSPSPKVRAIACFDIGEFVKWHPSGKNIITKLEMKVPIMRLMMEDKDSEYQSMQCWLFRSSC